MTVATKRSPVLMVLWLGLWLGVAGVLCWVAWPQQIERGCWLEEWPLDESCPTLLAPVDRVNHPEIFQQHLQANPGDAMAYARLLYALWKKQDPLAQDMLRHAMTLAPNDSRVLIILAADGLAKEDWPLASRALIRLVERGNPDARKYLLELMLNPATQGAVLGQLDHNAYWLDAMLATAPPKTPPVLLQQFVSEGHALGVVKTQTVLNMVDKLKASGDWMDAYTLWVALRQQVDSGLHNPGFDQRSLRRGFDWEWPQQAANKQGMRIAQVPASPRAGSMLELELTARGSLPVSLIGQTMLVLGENFKLEGRYMSDRMRSKEGLSWVLRCAAGGDRWAQSEPLKDTQRQWQGFEIRFKVPPECFGMVRLQLEASALWEARAGMSGVMYFDDFKLTPLGIGPAND